MIALHHICVNVRVVERLDTAYINKRLILFFSVNAAQDNFTGKSVTKWQLLAMLHDLLLPFRGG